MTNILVIEYNPTNQVNFRFSNPVIQNKYFSDWEKKNKNYKIHRKISKTLNGITKCIRNFENEVPINSEKQVIFVFNSHGSFNGDFFIDTNESYSLYKRVEIMIEDGKFNEVKDYVPTPDNHSQVDSLIHPIKHNDEDRKKKKEEEEEEEEEIEGEKNEEPEDTKSEDEELAKIEKMKDDLVKLDKAFFWPEFTINEIVFGDDFLRKVKYIKAKSVARVFFNRIYQRLAHSKFRYTYKMLIRDDKIFFPNVFDPIWTKTIKDFNIQTVVDKDVEAMTQLYSSIRQRIKDKFMFAPNYSVNVNDFMNGIEILSFYGFPELLKQVEHYSSKFIIFGQTNGYKFKERLLDSNSEVFRDIPIFTPFVQPERKNSESIEYFETVKSYLENGYLGIYSCIDSILKFDEMKKDYMRQKLNKMIEHVIRM